MIQKISLTAVLGVLLLASGVFAYTASVAFANEDEDVSAETEVDVEAESRLETMRTLLALLQQLAVILEGRVEAQGHVHDDSHDHAHDAHHDEAESGELVVTVEVHGERTHVHVFEPGEDEVTFFLDDYDVTEEDAIISAIAVETGLAEADIRAVIAFPSDHEADDELSDSDDEMDLEGIHIMADGSVMLGNGETLSDATVDADGMIVLSDGTLVEPAFDLRESDE